MSDELKIEVKSGDGPGLSINIPPTVGYWEFPGSSGAYGTTLHMAKRPRWLTRLLMNWLLEFKWVDK